MNKYVRSAAFGAAAAVMSLSVSAAVVYDIAVDHPSETGTAASVLATGLGGVGVTAFHGGTDPSWNVMASALTSSDVLLLGQSSDTFRADASATADILAFVTGGGTLIQLWGTEMSLFSSLVGTSIASGFTTSTGTTFSKTAAAAGTSFDGTADPLASASNHGGISLAALGGGTSIYQSATHSHVTMYSVGAGTVAFLSWDWCCGDSGTTRADWDAVMLAAATYGDAANVSEPTSLAVLGLGLVALSAARRRRVVVPAVQAAERQAA